MTILIDAGSRILVHGGERRPARLQMQLMSAYGTTLAAVVPGEPGAEIGDARPAHVPLLATITEAVRATGADAMLMFTPPLAVKAAAIEALDAGIRTLVCLVDDVPLHDALELRARAHRAGASLLGPASTGLLSPGAAKAGYYSEDVCMPGRVGVISKSGSVAYAVMSEMRAFGIGVSTIAGIGGEAVRGASFAELLPLYEADPDTDAVLMLGEIGGDDEEQAARVVAAGIRKPVIAFISGRTVKPGQSMGHAGAIAQQGRGDYPSKARALAAAGVHVAESFGDIIAALRASPPRNPA